MQDGPRLYYLDDIPTPYRLGVQKLIAERWPGDLRIGFCAESEPGRNWSLDVSGIDVEFLPGRQWRPRNQVNPFSFKWNPRVGRALETFRPDVVVLSGYVHPTMWAAARWCRRNRVPFGISCETSARSSTTSGWRWLAKRAVAGWVVRRMAFGLPVGRDAADYLRSFGPSEAPMYYFPNTPDTSAIVAEAQRLAEARGEGPLRAELGIPPHAPILLFVGRLIDAKRPLDAVYAFREEKIFKDAVLVIVGDGDRMAAMRDAADGDPRVIFTGWIKVQAKIAGLMSIATALLLPAQHEPWGAVVNEAMAAGTPVIASDRVGAAAELIDNGKNGFLVPVGDLEALRAAMRQVLADPDRAHRMGAAARFTAIEHGEEFAATNLVAGALKSIGMWNGNKARIMQRGSGSNEYIQYGCGLSAPVGWRNFDASPTLRAQRLPVMGSLMKRVGVRFPNGVEFGDVTKRLNVPDESARLVYCSHVLEHLPLEGLRSALRETHRILRHTGMFRLVVPDLETIVDAYRSNQGEDASVQFMRDMILGEEAYPAGWVGRIREAFGNTRHRWMWDFPGLARELREVGFVDIRRASYGDSQDEAFSELEEENRWSGCLGLECRKP